MTRTSPRRVIVIASSHRTGSSLLIRALDATGQAGHPREYFHPHALMRDRDGLGPVPLTLRGNLGQLWRRLHGDPAWARTGVARFSRRGVHQKIHRAADQYTATDGTFALKIHWEHYQSVMLAHGFDASVWGAPVQWIWIRRTDTLRQAISWVRALQTDRWGAGAAPPPGGPRPEVYDADRIEEHIVASRHDAEGWERYFTETGIVPLAITYEELDTTYDATMARVLSYLDIDAPVPPPPTRRQADEMTEEWVRRFVAERGAPANHTPG